MEIETKNGTFIACKKHSTSDYIVFYRDVPPKEEIAERRKIIENGNIPLLEPKCPLCRQEMTMYLVTKRNFEV